MMRIEVTAYDGRPPSQPLVGEFDERGGTIGRAEGNTLVLPDPKRYISRTHASIVFRAGRYVLCDVGSASPVSINGRQLGAGREATIQHGDVVSMANYTMRVVCELPGSAAAGAASTAEFGSSGAVKDDPLAAFAAGPSDSSPFGDLLTPPQGGPGRRDPIVPVIPTEVARKRIDRPPPPPPRAGDPASVVIPEDFDPFADPMAEPPRLASRPPESMDFGPATRDQKIDDIFGLSPAEGDDPLKPGSALADLDGPGGSPLLDPLVAIGAVPAKKPSVYPTQRDDTPEIHGSLPLPMPMPERVSSTESVVPAQTPWQGDGECAAGAEMRSPSDIVGNPAPIGDAAYARAPPAPSPAMPAATNPGAVGPGADALLHEFLAGAGIPDFQVPGGLTPQLMNVLGQLFRESTQGVLDLLLARTTTKRELRSAVTTIVARDNNPLKFSPSVEAGMGHLLAPHDRVGFMPPVRALEDAFDDLRAHEFGFMAGMRAALGGALARFNPTQLERRLAQKRVLDALLPMNRQARLWVLFGELYADISREAEDNFHTLFGAEFLKAYEEQIAKLDERERRKKN